MIITNCDDVAKTCNRKEIPRYFVKNNQIITDDVGFLTEDTPQVNEIASQNTS